VTRRADELPSALESWREIAARLESRRPALFLDYDGTLTPIVSQPEQALLPGRMRDVLRELVPLSTVAVVSGRDLADVTLSVGLDGLIYAGCHGFDIEGPGGLRMEHEGGRACLAALDEAERELEERLGPLPGARVERKRFAIASHYRNVAEADVPLLEAAVREVAARHRRLRLSRGRKVLELRPDVEWDKGRAVLWLLEALGLDGEDVLPFYLGDDVTDEDAFRALAGRGIGVLVGRPPRRTSAAYGLNDVGEVLGFLEQLVGLLKVRVPGGRARDASPPGRP
jgi:trehalose-phosphatase